MKFSLILFVGICFGLTVNAQVKPVYFYGNTLVRDSTIATSYGVFGKINDLWILKRYNIQDEMMNTGTYKDELMKIKHGEFVYYNSVVNFNYQNYASFYLKEQTRFISQKAKFEDNLPTGTWTWYYPNGKILTIMNYLNGAKNGQYGNYDKDGNTLEVGSYVMDEKDGVWYYDRGRRKETYKMGVLQIGEKQGKKKNANGTLN